ncbi:hypothetical protein XFF7767_250097 [Xanthomonas citri pv. fuscans]|nr:hypothetical protein XFF6960_220011 [Xanthomonas citri pv. fuscans]SOO04556.1 hypothetical protein XFF7767_250097 [Xanthomonas citri pv. fuscans]SOO07957.1 hypothetical protein XFF6970_120095 [Xanthomonas citri pv. fuscans]SOO12369.1 hypothetical protein XFF7766_110011 [Xanthomonas citri pv. fuscans]SOO44607.1 hypothetical protein XFF1815_60011 [Xanthomonas citri pv. fuscans]
MAAACVAIVRCLHGAEPCLMQRQQCDPHRKRALPFPFSEQGHVAMRGGIPSTHWV